MTDSIPNLEAAGHDSRNRRRWLISAVAGAAALGGAGLAWRSQRPPALHTAAETDLWQLRFDTPEGGSFSMAPLQGKLILLNFWATWCPPCVEELPLLSSFYRQNQGKGWHVLGLAVDQVEPVKRFLGAAPVTFPVALAGVTGVELSKSLGNLQGGLPFTVVFGPDGRVAHRKMGKVNLDDLQGWTLLK